MKLLLILLLTLQGTIHCEANEIKVEAHEMHVGQFSDGVVTITVLSFSEQHVEWLAEPGINSVIWKSKEAVLTEFEELATSGLTTGDGKHAMSHISWCYQPTASKLLYFNARLWEWFH